MCKRPASNRTELIGWAVDIVNIIDTRPYSESLLIEKGRASGCAAGFASSSQLMSMELMQEV
jgi:hypothetical protein